MGNLMDKPEAATPEILGGRGAEQLMSNLTPMSFYLRGLSRDISGGAAQNFGFDPQALFSGIQGVLGGRMGGGGQQFLNQGMQTGFAPGIAEALEARLRPGLDRSFERGSADIREQAAGLGALSSSGTVQNMQDMRLGLENQLQGQLGQAEMQSLLQGQNIQGRLAGGEQQLLSQLAPFMGQGLQQQQFQQTLPAQLQAMLMGAQGQSQFFQPTFGHSKGDQLLGSATSVGTAAAGANK